MEKSFIERVADRAGLAGGSEELVRKVVKAAFAEGAPELQKAIKEHAGMFAGYLQPLAMAALADLEAQALKEVDKIDGVEGAPA